MKLCMTVLCAFATMFICKSAFSATVLSFDNPSVSFQQGYGAGDRYFESDYFISTTSDPGHFGPFIRFNPFNQNTLVPNNGTIHVGITAFANPWLQRIDGGSFSLISLDVAEYSQVVSWRTTFDLTGHKSDGTMVFASLRLDRIFDGAGGVNDFQNYLLNWQDLVRVDFNSTGVTFDNLQVSSIPLPNALLLFVSGLFSLYGIKIKRFNLK